MSHTRSQIMLRINEIAEIEKEISKNVKNDGKKKPKPPKTPEEYAALEAKINRIQNIFTKGVI